MKCSSCGHESRTGAKFCEECGQRLVVVCSSCGTQLSPTAKFCSECGHPAGEATASTSAVAARFEKPEGYTPKHLAEKILTSKAALEGERKQVTALFADLKGSMELFADRDPEDVRKILDPVLEHMIEAVHRYEGTVIHVLGDGIVALFGAPLAHEDHAVRGCYSALRMQESVKRYAEGVRRTEGIPIQIRVGLNSGEVVVRSIGSDLRMDYTVVGQTTNVAARMEQMALPGSVLISADTLALAEGFVQAKSLGPMSIKGLEVPLEVFEVTGASTMRSRLHAAAVRGLSRFVGRENELDQIRQALERAASGHGQVVAVVGDAGVGKSRLYWEFTHSHRTEGWLIVESSSVSYGKATSFLPIIDLLRAYFQIEAGDVARRIRERVMGKLLSLDRALEPSIPALLWLLDVPVEDAQWTRLDPPQRRHRALEAVKRLLLRESQAQPLLVLFEDLHWIDAETQALLDSLVDSLPNARLLLLVNYRPEYQHSWSGKSYYRQISIDPLRAESAHELLEALLGTDPDMHSLKRLLIERTEGNPFFIEESVRTLVETKALMGERGSYRLARASQKLDIPATAKAIVAARIDRLDAEHKRLLQAAAVIGKDVPFALLENIAELSDEDLRRGLSNLQGSEYLYEARLFPDLEYTFKHALTHEVAYGSLLHDRRRKLHGQIVEAIEQLYSDRMAERINQLADHAFRGELWEKAVTYLRQAGSRALTRSAYREAATYFENALTALTHLPENKSTLELAIDLRFDLRNALWPLGEFEKLLGILREAERLAKELDDARRLGWIAVYMSANLWITGRPAEARLDGQNALTIGESLDELPIQIAAEFYLGVTCATSGEYRLSTEPLLKIVKRLEGDKAAERCGLPFYPSVLARSWLVWSLAECGEFAEGARCGEEGIRMAESYDHPYSLAHVCYDLGYLYTIQGETAAAVSILNRGFAIMEEWNLSFLRPLLTWFLGHARVRSGQVVDGLPLLEASEKVFRSMGSGAFQALNLVHLGEALVLANRADDALRAAQEALAFSRARGQRSYEAYSLCLLGQLASQGPSLEFETADAHYQAAITLTSELGMLPLLAHCHQQLGRLYLQNGQLPSQEHLANATMLYRKMSMQAGGAQ